MTPPVGGKTGVSLPPGPAPGSARVGLSGPQLTAATAMLLGAQVDALLRAGAPPETAVDLLVGLTAALVARVNPPIKRYALAARVAASFEDVVRHKEVEMRTTPGGVYVP